MKILDIDVTFRTHTLKVAYDFYANDNLALILVDPETEQPYLRASVNFEVLEEDEVYLKDWSENTGVVKAFAKLLIPTGITQRSGFVKAELFRLGPELSAAILGGGGGSSAPNIDPVDLEPAPAGEPDLDPPGGEPIIDEVSSSVAYAEGSDAPEPEDSEPERAAPSLWAPRK